MFTYFIPLTVNLTKNSKLEKFVHESNALWKLSGSSMGALRELVAVAGIMTTDPDIIGISSVLEAKIEENSERMCNIDHEVPSPYTIHTAVLPKPSLINANVNSAITAMLDIVQPTKDDVDEDATYDEVLPHEKYARNQPIISVSRESNEPINKWTDNKTLFTGAFQDKFLFGQDVPTGLPTQQNWKHFSLYYDG